MKISLSDVALFGAAVFVASLTPLAATPVAAQSSTSCNGGNVSGFNRTAAAGGAANINQSGTFLVGDVITATVTGIILSVAADVNPGNNLLIFINGGPGSGSFTFPSTGTFTINGALNAGPGGGASLVFTCISGAGAAGAAGGMDLTPQVLVEVTDNADETNRVTEEQALDDLYEEAMRADYEADQEQTYGGAPPVEELTEVERAALAAQLEDLQRREAELEQQVAENESRIDTIDGMIELTKDTSSSAPTPSTILAEIFTPIDISAEEEKRSQAERARLNAEKQDVLGENAVTQNELNDVRQQISEIEAKLPSTPTLDEGDVDIELRPFVANEPVDRFDRQFRDIVRYFDEPDRPQLQPFAGGIALDPRTAAWIQASYTQYEQDDATRLKGKSLVLATGVHRDFWEDLRLGLLFSTAWNDTSSSINALNIDTRSYSAGVYARYQLEGLALSARARYGWSDSDIGVGGTTGSYDSDRVNVYLSATGQEDINSVVWVRHTTSVSSTWSNRDAYTNSAGTRVGSSDTWGGRLAIGPTIGMTLDKTETFAIIEPSLGLSGSYVFSNRDSQGGQVATSEDDYFSVAISPGISFATQGGTSLSFNTQYFGIGSDLNGWTVGGTLSIPLN